MVACGTSSTQLSPDPHFCHQNVRQQAGLLQQQSAEGHLQGGPAGPSVATVLTRTNTRQQAVYDPESRRTTNVNTTHSCTGASGDGHFYTFGHQNVRQQAGPLQRDLKTMGALHLVGASCDR